MKKILKEMKLSIIIPAYNSEKKIRELIKRIKLVKMGNVKQEIIVIDDFSKDKTYQVLMKIKDIRVVHHKKNTGKGGALKTGFRLARGSIFLILDDDLEYDPKDIPSLLEPILSKKTQVVFGSRRLNKNNKYSTRMYYWGGVLLDTIISKVLKIHVTDAITGSKIFTREVYEKIKPIESKGFEEEAEITAKIIKKGFKLTEVP